MGIWNEVATLVIKLVVAVITVLLGEIALPWVKTQMIPWLREKRLYHLVSIFVQAAHKLADTGRIEKKEKLSYVIGMLESKHVEVTPEVSAFIESAVVDLDRALMEGVKKITDELTTEE